MDLVTPSSLSTNSQTISHDDSIGHECESLSGRSSRASSIESITARDPLLVSKWTPEQKEKRNRIREYLFDCSLSSFPNVQESLKKTQTWSLKNILGYFFNGEEKTEEQRQRQDLVRESRSQIFEFQENAEPDDEGKGTWRHISDAEATERYRS